MGGERKFHARNEGPRERRREDNDVGQGISFLESNEERLGQVKGSKIYECELREKKQHKLLLIYCPDLLALSVSNTRVLSSSLPSLPAFRPNVPTDSELPLLSPCSTTGLASDTPGDPIVLTELNRPNDGRIVGSGDDTSSSDPFAEWLVQYMDDTAEGLLACVSATARNVEESRVRAFEARRVGGGRRKAGGGMWGDSRSLASFSPLSAEPHWLVESPSGFGDASGGLGVVVGAYEERSVGEYKE